MLNTLKVTVHLPSGKPLTFTGKEIVQVTLQPYPAVAVRNSDGTIRRFLLCAIETLDEDTLVDVPPPPLVMG